MKNIKSRPSSYLFSALVVFLLLAASVVGQSLPLPSGPPASAEVRFAALGDTGRANPGQLAIAGQMLALQRKAPFDLVLFLGDNIYESGDPADLGRKFALPYRQLIENGTELKGVLGNHDIRSNGKGGDLVQQLIFGMGARPFYSFTRGGGLVEFFGLNSNDLARPGADQSAREQLRWLDERLARSTAKWKIVFLHHPLYSSAKKHGWNSADRIEMESVRSALEPILLKHGVKLVLAGHDHVYERVKPQSGIQHFVSGAGSETRIGDLQPNSPYYGFGDDRQLSFMLFSVRPDGITFWSINSGGSVIDSGTIK
jgi:3',5'-cyclic AMP phosphodiesterase CpdA